MIERFDLATDDALEAALFDLGSAIDLPATPDIARAVDARLRSAPAGRIERPHRRRMVRRAVLLAAVLALLAAGVAVGLRLGLDLLRIDFGPAPTPTLPAATPDPSTGTGGPGTTLGLGLATTLEAAREAAAFDLVEAAALGPPDQVYAGGPSLRGQVAFVYAATPDLPPSDLLDGAGLLITQNAGESDDGLARKLISSGMASLESVSVDGARGYWISGEPHWFWYLATDGEVIDDGRRLVGDTLVWERDGILYRIEGAISKARALEIASTMR